MGSEYEILGGNLVQKETVEEAYTATRAWFTELACCLLLLLLSLL
jgi:hypothetical protein